MNRGEIEWVIVVTVMVLEQCIKQFVATVNRNVKFPLYRRKGDQYTVENVIQNIALSEIES